MRARWRATPGGRHHDRRARRDVRPARRGGARPAGARGPAARRAAERHHVARRGLRRHAAAQLHPRQLAGRLRAAGLREREPRLGPRPRPRVRARLRGHVAAGQRDIPVALHGRLAQHRQRRRVRRGDRDRHAAEARPPADDLGDRPRRDPGRRRARAVRLDGQGAASRAVPRRTATPPRCWRRRASRAAPTASRARAAGPGHVGRARPEQGHRRPRRVVGAARQHVQAVPVRDRQPPRHRRVHPAARRARHRARRRRRAAPARRAARHRPVRQDGHPHRPGGQVLRRSTAPRSGSSAVAPACASTPTRRSTTPTSRPSASARPARPTTRRSTEDGVHVELELTDGRVLEKRLTASLGNLQRPLTDDQLSAKFRDQATLAVTAEQAELALELSWRIDELADVAELVDATVPDG